VIRMQAGSRECGQCGTSTASEANEASEASEANAASKASVSVEASTASTASESSAGETIFENGDREDTTVRIVCISDTHGSHRDIQLPPGDILIHAGDFTLYGKKDTVVKKGRPIPSSKPFAQWESTQDTIYGADDFNAWLGEQAFEHKIVVLGNHEKNHDWTPSAAAVVSNATLLQDSSAKIEIRGVELVIWGSDFSWPGSEHPHAKRVRAHLVRDGNDADILIVHGPVAGQADAGSGCPILAQMIATDILPSLGMVVSGHVHAAHGVSRQETPKCRGAGETITFVNAASVTGQRQIAHRPTVLDITRGRGSARISVQVVDNHTSDIMSGHASNERVR
jgi:predicted phosphodiesterase